MENTMNWIKKNWVAIAVSLGIVIILYYLSKGKGMKSIAKAQTTPTPTPTSSSTTKAGLPEAPKEKTEKDLAEEVAKWANDTLAKNKSFDMFKVEANKLGYLVVQDREPEMGGFDPTRIRVATTTGIPAPNMPMQKIISGILSIG